MPQVHIYAEILSQREEAIKKNQMFNWEKKSQFVVDDFGMFSTSLFFTFSLENAHWSNMGFMFC